MLYMKRYRVKTGLVFITDASGKDDAKVQFFRMMIELNKLLPSNQIVAPKEKMEVEKLEF